MDIKLENKLRSLGIGIYDNEGNAKSLKTLLDEVTELWEKRKLEDEKL